MASKQKLPEFGMIASDKLRIAMLAADGIEMTKSAAVTLYGVADLNKAGKKQLANWLRNLADDVEKNGHEYHRRLIARKFVRKMKKS